MSSSAWVAAHFTLTAGGGLPVRALRDGVPSRCTTAPRLPALPRARCGRIAGFRSPNQGSPARLPGKLPGAFLSKLPHAEADLAVVVSGSGSAGVQPVSGLACSRAGLSMSGEGMKDPLCGDVSPWRSRPREQGARSPNLASLHIDVQSALVAVVLADAWPNPSGAGNSPRRSPAERRSHAACARDRRVPRHRTRPGG
jgi:hypothetical protein